MKVWSFAFWSWQAIGVCAGLAIGLGLADQDGALPCGLAALSLAVARPFVIKEVRDD